jgi:hypothetical protein
LSLGPGGAASTAKRGLSRSAFHLGATTSAGAASALVAAGQSVFATGSASLGAGYNSLLRELEAAISPGHGGMSPRRQARVWDAALRAAVRRLQGCLVSLPEDLRRVLELRAGIDERSALSREAVAGRLHISVRRVARLEILALRRLGMTARNEACGAATEQPPSGPFVLGAFGPLIGEEAGPAGGVEAVRYSNSPSPGVAGPPLTGPSPGSTSVLGLNAWPSTGVALLLFLAVLAVALVVGLLFADGQGRWPFHREWRSRWIHRRPWNWRK